MFTVVVTAVSSVRCGGKCRKYLKNHSESTDPHVDITVIIGFLLIEEWMHFDFSAEC